MKTTAKRFFNGPLTALNGLLFLVWILVLLVWVVTEHLRYATLVENQRQQLQRKTDEYLGRAQEEARAVTNLLRSNQLIIEGLQVADHNKLLDTTVPMLKLPYVQFVSVYRADGEVAIQAHRPAVFGRTDELHAWLVGPLSSALSMLWTAATVGEQPYLFTGARVDDLNGLAGFVVTGTLLDGPFAEKLALATGTAVHIRLGALPIHSPKGAKTSATRHAITLPLELAQLGLHIELVDAVDELHQSWLQNLWLGIASLLVAGAFMLAVAVISSRALARSRHHLLQARDQADAASRAKGELLAREEEQRRRLDMLVRCANVGSYEWDAASKTAHFSPRVIEMLGYPSDTDTHTWRVQAFIHPNDVQTVKNRFSQLMLPTRSPESVSHVEPCDFRLMCRDGTAIWVHSDAIAVRDEHGATQKFLASIIDITPILAAEADTRAALLRQQQLNELRTRFVAMTSHEFRTPLATILSSTELLKYYEARLPAEEKAAIVASIEVGVQRMTAMLDKILNIGKAEAGMLEFRPTTLNLRSVCESMVDQAVKQHPHSPCQVDHNLDFSPSEGHFDEKLLRHIFDNLLTNAIKYSPSGGTVHFRVQREGEKMRFDVTDQGIGIPQDDLQDLFSTFHRASNVGQIPGTGLGLAIVKNSVELHGGTISVASAPQQGTCFTVLL